MGITPSKVDFIALEGYANKSDEERMNILTNAGMEITAIDNDIASFLGAEDEKLGAFIRGIITICIDLSNTNRNKEFKKYLDECKNLNNAILEQMHTEMNETIRMREEQWKLKEEYYFKNTTTKAHQIQIEVGAVDKEDRDRIKDHKYNKCKEMIMGTLPDSDSSEDEKVLTWETNSNTSSDDGKKLDKLQRKRYRSLHQASQQALNNTPNYTNKNTQMHEENENGNFGNSRHQSVTMAITDDHDMGENSLKSKESMYKPKTADDLKYFARLFTYQIRDQQDDQSIIELINTNKLLEYHVNTLGKITRYGNEYTYVGFFTETAKNNFIQDGRVLGGIGNFKDLFWLNKLNKNITMSITGIDKKYTDIEEVTKELEKKLGKIIDIKGKEKLGGKISMRVTMEIKCTEEELLNTWGILVNGRLIKVEPENYKHHVIKQRGRINASILDIPKEIDEVNFTKQLKEARARYWYKLNDNNGFYKIIAYFNNKEDRNRAIKATEDITTALEKCKITDDTTTADVTPARKQITERKIVTLTTQETIRKEIREETPGTTITHNQKEDDTTTKETLFNHTEETTEIIEEEENMTHDIIKGMAKMNLHNTDNDTTQADTTNTINTKDIDVTTTTIDNTITTIITTITTNRENNTRKEQEHDAMDTTVTEIEDTIEAGTKETEIMEDIEWLGAINWESFSDITRTKEEEREEGEVEKEGGKTKTNKNKKKKKKKIKSKKEKNNNLKIGCINVRGMNNDKKQGDIRKFLAKERWDIAIINETKLKEAKGKYIYMGWEAYECINSSYNSENAKNGIIILLRKEINDRRYAIEKIDGHVIKLDILFKGNQKNIRIIGIYNPNDDKPTTKIIEAKLAKWMNEATNLDYEIIILGDFNESANTKKKKKKTPLTSTIIKHGLQDIHECLTAGKDMLNTWKSGEYSSRIDFIFLSEGLLEEIISHEILDIEDFETDHKALTIKFKVKEKIKSTRLDQLRSIKKTSRQIKLDQNDWTTIADKVEQHLENLETNQQLDREFIWDKIVELVNNEKKSRLTEKKTDNEKRKKNRKIDIIEHNIRKTVNKTINTLWKKRSSDDYKYSFKEFEENLEIENWGTTDTGNHNAVKIIKLIKSHDRIGIDQGEVWSPILWRIFYDALLSRLNVVKEETGYRICEERILDRTTKEKETFEIITNVTAFMDDTTLISSNKIQLEKMIEICHEFFHINDIKANVSKYELIKINNKEEDLIIKGEKINKINNEEEIDTWEYFFDTIIKE
ncbi:hypothetical protein RhiirA4_469210 [Rhizophagus irregularis]|uniref:Endonuclease/exonuclease/phosphatase domain-containing protein n=1 Tax=Rhizophagus irregularis TaxID=588596 RepID=A0A2I1GZ70_9GLOM|nr:hypothetical protein RhiirA4_469210 [Rhizophagus irregularis]